MEATGRQPQRAPDRAPIDDERYRPEQIALYRIVDTETSPGAEPPRSIVDEFDAFLECDILAHGFQLQAVPMRPSASLPPAR